MAQFKPQNYSGKIREANLKQLNLSIKHMTSLDQSMVAQMVEWAPRDRKVPSLNPALDLMRHVSKYNPD